MLHLVKNSGPVRVTTAARQADERETKGQTALRLVGTACFMPGWWRYTHIETAFGNRDGAIDERARNC